MLRSPSENLLFLVASILRPSLANSFISIFIPFTTIVFRYLLGIFYLLSIINNWLLKSLLLRSILLTKLFSVHFLIDSRAQRLLKFKLLIRTVLTVFFINKSFISDFKVIVLVLPLCFYSSMDEMLSSFLVLDVSAFKVLLVLQKDAQEYLSNEAYENFISNDGGYI